MKLKAIHTYQCVKFNGKNYNYMTNSRDLGLEGIELEFLVNIGAVRVKGPKDDILVFTTNIAYAIPDDTTISNEMLMNRGKLKNIDVSKAVKG